MTRTYRHSGTLTGANNAAAKLNAKMVAAIRDELANGQSLASIARRLREQGKTISVRQLARIRDGESWRQPMTEDALDPGWLPDLLSLLVDQRTTTAEFTEAAALMREPGVQGRPRRLLTQAARRRLLKIRDAVRARPGRDTLGEDAMFEASR